MPRPGRRDSEADETNQIKGLAGGMATLTCARHFIGFYAQLVTLCSQTSGKVVSWREEEHDIT